MAKQDLKLEPFDINDNIWWYEEMKGIDIHLDTSDGHISFIIPWANIRNSLKRRDK